MVHLCFDLFLVSAQCVASSLKNNITEHYPDSQVIPQQELAIRICCTLCINIVNADVNACFDHRYSTAVQYKMLVRRIYLSL